MPKNLEGQLDAKGKRFAIAVARFNETVTEKLLQGALACLEKHGAEESVVATVPGALELPITADSLASTGKFDAVICLGAVIRGETPHFDQVVNGTTAGVVRVSLDRKLPIIYGVLTTDSVEQAMNRAGLKSGNKGWDAAMTAIEMANLLTNLCDLSKS